MIVRWESAEPVRQALAVRAGAETLAGVRRHYIVAVTSLPFGAARLAEEPEKIRSRVALLIKDKPQVPADRVEIRPQPGAPGVRLYFPRDAAITLDDKSVQLLMRLDPYQVRRKFKLKEMIFRGRLEL